MNRKTVLMTLAVLFAAVTVCYAAENVNIGTWKLNEAKSKIGAGMQKSSTVVYAADGDNVKITVDGTTADGKPLHSEWTGKFDGKDYAVTGDPASDMRAYTQVNPHTLHMVVKKDGKETSSGRIVVSADGKSRMVTITGTDSKGKKISGTSVYDKE
jgi:ribosomal protein L21E